MIASASIAITFGPAILMTIADHKNYPSIGSGLWWAAQTVTTVGHGDHTPVTVSERLVAALVMLVGIGFLTVITAAITSTFASLVLCLRANWRGPRAAPRGTARPRHTGTP